MAYASTQPEYDFSPERAIQEIKSERKRKSMMALGVGLLALFVLGAGVYLSYNDVPAPESPANARPNLAEPYR